MKASQTGTVKMTEGERTRRRTTVALALRDKTLALTLAARLSADCDAVTLICPFTKPAQLEPWLEEHPADVLLLEERWLPRLAAGTMSRLSERRPEQRVLLVGDRACTALAEQVVRNRFQGFLLARDAADACAKAVRTVKRGELWVPRALLVQLLFEHLQAAGSGSAETPAEDKLTPREVEIINYVRRGFANKQIGEALAIREDTVKKHLRNAYTKLGVHRRTQIITSAAERFISG
jgi:two-component system, NarL family, nitrate/nitrite response regulator NarL